MTVSNQQTDATTSSRAQSEPPSQNPDYCAQPGRRRMLRLTSAALLAAPALIKRLHARDIGVMTSSLSSGDSGKLLRRKAPPFQHSLAIPGRVAGELRDGVRHYGLRTSAGMSELVAGMHTPTWGYNGPLLGPTLVIPRGEPVHMAVTNDLEQSTTTHWHGAIVPGAVDGGPHMPIQPGQTLEYRFTLDQPGATLWFHPHPDTRTGAQAYAGLAGLLLVDDGVDRRLSLPHTWGVDDIPVIVQDRRLAADGALLYMTETRDLMGMKGDHFVVNGREQPYVAVPAQRVRLRLLNGSNGRFFNFAFSDGRAFQVIATDAGLLARSASVQSLLLGPGERAEAVVDLSGDQGRTLVLQSRSAAVVHELASSPLDADAWDRGIFDLLQLRVGSPNGAATIVPATLAEIERLPTAGAAVRRFTLQGMNRAGMMHPVPVDRSAPPDSGPGGMSLGIGGQKLFSINHQFFDMGVINQRVRLGSVEVWEIRNEGPMAHPIHVHGVSFQILSRNGNPPSEWERGWKDTVLVRIAETARIAMRFTQPAEADRPYAYHCHILEHEGNGMMGQFTVT